ncbi:hypothetical protein MUN78_00025 [Leucobacter allii]|uniref:DUF3618 domain-containing protein n=1 Tax=Leucobacter allii TaxID=2932247 RepID=A0ABY4FLV8_9MICO|nr:hypothetical protein [Leucobacter allii]UOQ57272.1 hypothetical protein MUN78_00025 [Leucobacter allii]UOR01714.1 hypothetical protein MUN77_16640 [Leucobacter allii]
MNQQAKQQGIEDAARARAELYDTLGRLKVQLNYAQRVDDAVDDAKQRIVEGRRRNPLGFAAAALGVAVVAGAIVWGVSSAVVNRFR